MNVELIGAIIAIFIVIGGWVAIASLVFFLSHLRMVRVESTLAGPALPAHELPLLWLAVSSIAWPFAAGVGLVGLFKREWVRLGRNATLILLVHFTVAVLEASVAAVANVGRGQGSSSAAEEMFPIVVMACLMVGVGALLATILFWIWSGRRMRRIQSQPRRGPTPGSWRFVVYLSSLLFWPVGIVCLPACSSSENVHVGTSAFRCSLLNIAGIALSVCLALPILIHQFAPQIDGL